MSQLTEREYEFGKTVVLFDTQHAAYRAFHTRQLSTHDGIPTSVLHGVVELVGTTLRDANTNKFILCWDGPKGNIYRRQLFSNYKARHFRDRNEEEQAQMVARSLDIEVCQKALKLLCFPQLDACYVDGDDMVGMVANMLAKMESIHRVLIISDDKDYLQLVTDKIHVYRAIQDDYVDPETFRQQHGFEPEQYVDFKALVGEDATGDNIPGAKGVGPVPATNLVATPGDIESIIKHCESVQTNPKARKFERTIWAEREKVRLSYKLSRIHRSYKDFLNKQPDGDATGSVKAKLKKHIVRGITVPRDVPFQNVMDFRTKYEFGSSLTTEDLCQKFGFSVS